MRKVQLFLFLIVFSAFAATGERWRLDLSNSYISFFVDAKLHDVNGTFKQFSLENFSFEGGDLANLKGKLLIDTSSVYTRNKRRDKHLREDDFFYTEKYKEAIVEVSRVFEKDENWFASISLQIRNIKKTYEIPVTVYLTGDNLTVKARLRLDRKDFDLTGNSVTNAIIDDQVVIKCKLVMSRKKA